MSSLTQKKCQPCEGIGSALSESEAQDFLNQVSDWTLTADRKGITKSWTVKNFMSAVRFINDIAPIAEGEDHHPDIHLVGYRNVVVELTTHALDGLTENDFILAAKLDELKPELKM